MTICPVAIAIGCRKCPVFSICPAKSIIGDQPAAEEAHEPAAPMPKHKSRAKRKAKAKR